jgi:hypothetical protein
MFYLVDFIAIMIYAELEEEMIPKWEYVLISQLPTAPRSILERYLGYFETQHFLRWHKGREILKNMYGNEHYLISDVDEWEKSIRCTAEAPNYNRPDYHDHDFQFSHETNSDHGDECWRCKNCGKLWYKEGADA